MIDPKNVKEFLAVVFSIGFALVVLCFATVWFFDSVIDSLHKESPVEIHYSR